MLRAHQSLPVSPLGLKITAVAAVQKDVRGLVVKGSRRLPSKIPRYIRRLMGKETGKLSPGARAFPSPAHNPLAMHAWRDVY